MSKPRILVTGGSGFIGIHLVQILTEAHYKVLNLDIQPPTNGDYFTNWQSTSLLDYQALKTSIQVFNPDYIVHLGATTTQNADSILDFEVNVQGTKNLLQIATQLDSLRKLIFTSTQYVNSPGYTYSDSLDQLRPYGFYGESKLMGEVMTQNLMKRGNWTVIRPTTIWGPWHPVLVQGLWKQIVKGRYFHPAGDDAVKSYGYVKNTVWQIVRLIEIENCYTDRKVFYLGDENIRQVKWVSAFVHQLTNQAMREIPKFVLLVASEIGELLTKLGVKFPLYRSRYRNLVTSNPSPLEDTLLLLGPSPISLEKAVDETCSWLKQVYVTSKRVD